MSIQPDSPILFDLPEGIPSPMPTSWNDWVTTCLFAMAPRRRRSAPYSKVRAVPWSRQPMESCFS